MRRDSIFYKIFQQSPGALFDLLPEPPPNASDYRFDSVAVKEPKFEIDGLFLPPDTGTPGIVYFCEVQFQKDEQLYERLFGELFLYFYRNRSRHSDWQAVIIYPTRSVEQSQRHPYRALLSNEQVHRIFLNELGAIRQLPLGVAAMVLTTLEQQQAAEEARYLLMRVEQETVSGAERRAIMEVVTAIMVYQFAELSRVEVEAMLNMRLQETRVYQEAKEEGRQEGRQIGQQEGRQIGQQEGRQIGQQEGRQIGQQEGRQIGQQEGRQMEAANLVLRQLQRRLGELPPELVERVAGLPVETLENLGEALLDFSTLAELKGWLEEQGEGRS